MSCPYGREDLSAYVDAEVDEPTASGIREHLRACPSCKREVGTLKTVAGMVAELPRVEPDAAVTWNAERMAPRTPASLHCPVVLPDASALIDGELPSEEAQNVLGHLAGCEPCYQAFKDLERLSEAMIATDPAPVPAGLEARIMAAIAAEGRFSLRRWLLGACEVCTPPARVAFRYATAAAFVMAVVLGVLHFAAPGGLSLEAVTAPTTAVAVIQEVSPAATPEPAGPTVRPTPVKVAGEASRPGAAPRRPLADAAPRPAPEGSSAPLIARPPGEGLAAPPPARETPTAPLRDLAPVGPMMVSRPPSHPAPTAEPDQPGISHPDAAPSGGGPSGPPPTRMAGRRTPGGAAPETRAPRVPSPPSAPAGGGIDPERLRAAEERLNETVRAVGRTQPKGFTINP